ncbi:MAG: PilZ domain-containing protein [Desulfamplus sp.]|nr:PilZ domain-containing protein [Desulfamplus sp.]
MEKNLQPMLNEEDGDKDSEDRFKYQYKEVLLSGDFRHFSKNIHGYITVVKISLQGVCFETMRQNNFQQGDILDISFNLDDGHESLIKRRVTVEWSDEKMVEAVFYNPPPYDKKLGFYLL